MYALDPASSKPRCAASGAPHQPWRIRAGTSRRARCSVHPESRPAKQSRHQAPAAAQAARRGRPATRTPRSPARHAPGGRACAESRPETPAQPAARSSSAISARNSATGHPRISRNVCSATRDSSRELTPRISKPHARHSPVRANANRSNHAAEATAQAQASTSGGSTCDPESTPWALEHVAVSPRRRRTRRWSCLPMPFGDGRRWRSTTSWSMGCCSEAADEVAVDLDVVERQALEVGEGPEAGAEVVEGQRQPRCVQAAAAKTFAASMLLIAAVSVSSKTRHEGSMPLSSSDRDRCASARRGSPIDST